MSVELNHTIIWCADSHLLAIITTPSGRGRPKRFWSGSWCPEILLL